MVTDKSIPAGAVIYPETREDCKALIRHFEYTMSLMTLPPKGKQTTTPNSNTGFAE